jgi:hypothetical protein
MNIEPEFIEGGNKNELRNFLDLPSFSAVKISEGPLAYFEEKKRPLSPTET